jgi:hypothetical protein
MARLELDQHIHVTVRSKIVPQHRAKQRQLADVMALAERGNSVFVQRDIVFNHEYHLSAVMRVPVRRIRSSLIISVKTGWRDMAQTA